MSEEQVGVPVLERAPDGADGPLDALFFVVIALFLGKHRYVGRAMHTDVFRCIQGARRCFHKTYVGLDQSAFHSVVVGEFQMLTSSCAKFEQVLDKCSPSTQVWGVLLGIGSETYTQHWRFIGPGIAFWEVACHPVHPSFLCCTWHMRMVQTAQTSPSRTAF